MVPPCDKSLHIYADMVNFVRTRSSVDKRASKQIKNAQSCYYIIYIVSEGGSSSVVVEV